jgi:hypothetical protein
MLAMALKLDAWDCWAKLPGNPVKAVRLVQRETAPKERMPLTWLDLLRLSSVSLLEAARISSRLHLHEAGLLRLEASLLRLEASLLWDIPGRHESSLRGL